MGPRLYVTQPHSITVIDYEVKNVGTFNYTKSSIDSLFNIHNLAIKDVAVDYFTNLVYVADSNSSTIYVVDGSNTKSIRPIKVHSPITRLVVNNMNHKIFATDGNTAMYVID
ncbi:MAG: hypothetical protein WBQ25_11630 [Nitrososphaeraceae archaeon]